MPLLSIEEDTLHIPHATSPISPVAAADRPPLVAAAAQALSQGLDQFRQGRYPIALSQLQQALENYQRAADQPNTTKVLLVLANAYYRLADYLWAADYGRQCLQLAKELNDPQAEMRVLNNLGMIYRAKGLNRQAATLYEASWLMANTLGETKVELQILQNLGNTYQTLHHYAQAIECYEKFLRLNEENPGTVASNHATRRILAQLTHASLAIQDFNRAIVYLQRHLALACTLGDSKGAATLIDDLSQCYLALNQVRSFQSPDPMISDSMVSV